MKKKRTMALLLACSILVPTMLGGCSKKKSEEDDGRVDLGATTVTDENSGSDVDGTDETGNQNLQLLAGPDITKQTDITFHKEISLDLRKAVPGLTSTIPDVCCCSDDSAWIYFETTAQILRFDYEGNLLRTYTLDSTEFIIDEDAFHIGYMSWQNGDLFCYSFYDGTVRKYKLNKDTGNMLFINDYEMPKISSANASPRMLGVTDDRVHIAFYGYNGASAYESVTVCSYTSDGKLTEAYSTPTDVLGGWYLGDQFYTVISEKGDPVLVAPGADGKLCKDYKLQTSQSISYTEISGTDQYIVNKEGVWKTDEGTKEWSTCILWSKTDVKWSYFNDTAQCEVSPDGQKALLFNTQGTSAVSLFVPAEDTRGNRTVIQLSGAQRDDAELMALVDAFNAENKDYYISPDFHTISLSGAMYVDGDTLLKDKYKQALAEYTRQLMQAKDGPVLFLTGDDPSEPLGTEDDFYDQKEFFQDLLPYWKKEDPKWQELFLQVPFQDAETKGTMYSIPYQLAVHGYHERTPEVPLGQVYDEVKDKSCYSDWLSYFKSHDFTYMTSTLSSEEAIYYELCNNLSHYRKADGLIGLDDPQFRALLELAQTYLRSDAANAPVRSCPTWAVVSMERDLETPAVQYKDESGNAYYLDDPMIDHPSSDGKSKMVYASSKFLISAYASEFKKQGAWEFIRFALEKNSNFKWENIKEALDAYEHPAEHGEYWAEKTGYDPMFRLDRVAPMTSEERTAFEESIRSISHIYTPDPDLYRILCEATKDYMEGNETIDQVIPKLQDRINEYLKEN